MTHPNEDAAAKIAKVRAVLDAFDWEFDDRQSALEAIDSITADDGNPPAS